MRLKLKKIKEFQKKYVNNGLNKPTSTSRLLACIVIFFLLFAFGIFCYFNSGVVERRLGSWEDGNTFTISKALAYGNKPGFIIFTTMGFFYLIHLLVLRGPKRLFLRKVFLLLISYSFLISLLWFTTSYNETLHYSLAGVIFSFILLFNLITFYLFFKKYRSDRNLFILMGLINVTAYVSLIVFAILRGSLNSDIFAALEIVFALLFLVTIAFLGYY